MANVHQKVVDHRATKKKTLGVLQHVKNARGTKLVEISYTRLEIFIEISEISMKSWNLCEILEFFEILKSHEVYFELYTRQSSYEYH